MALTLPQIPEINFLLVAGDIDGDGQVSLKDRQPCTLPEVCDMIVGAIAQDSSKIQQLQSLVDTDTDTNTTYSISTINSDPDDGFYELILTGNDGSTVAVTLPDSTELEDVDTDTTYTLINSGSQIILVGSDGSSSPVNVQTFDEELVENADGSYTFTNDDGNTVTIARPRTGAELCAAVLSALQSDPAKVVQWQALIDTDTDTVVTYVFGGLIDDNPSDGVKKLVLDGSDGSQTCVLIPDSTELPDEDTTYVLQVINDVITLIGNDGSTSSGTVTIQTFDENFQANGDGSFTFTDDDGSIVTIPAPRTAEELCAAVISSLLINPSKLASLATALTPLIDTDTVVTYTFGSIVDDNPTDGVKKLVLDGSDGSQTCVLIPDSTELPDVDTNYVLQVVNDTITLIGSDGSTSGGAVTIETFDESFDANGDGSFTFTDDDGSTITIPAPRTAQELCAAVLGDLLVNPAKLNALAAVLAPLIDTNTVPVNFNVNVDNGTADIVLSDGSIVPGTLTYTPEDVFVVDGNYSPNSAGDVVIPLNDGSGNLTLSGLVSPDDNDIEDFSVVDNGDGTFEVTSTLEDGSTLSAFTVGRDDFLSSLSLQGDGCTLEAELDGGTMLTVDLCGLISEITQSTNPDGSVTYTHSTGGNDTSWTGAMTYSVCYADGTPDATATSGQQFMDGPSLKERLVDPGFACDTNPTNPDALVTAQQIRDWFKPTRYQSVNNTVVPLPPDTSVIHNTWTSPVCGLISRAHHVRIMHDPADLDLLGGQELISFILTPEGLSWTNEMTTSQRKEGTTIDPRMNAAGTSSVAVGDVIEHLIVSVDGAIPAEIRFSRMGAHLINPFAV